jgi:hypothetical protein
MAILHEITAILHEITAILHEIAAILHEITVIRHEFRAMLHEVTVIQHGIMAILPGIRVIRHEITAILHEIRLFYTRLRLSLWNPSHSLNHQTNRTYSVHHNTGLSNIEFRPYVHATCFGPFSGHHQACQYKNLAKEDITRYNLRTLVQSLFSYTAEF